LFRVSKTVFLDIAIDTRHDCPDGDILTDGTIRHRHPQPA
jgi:hypothetical protein